MKARVIDTGVELEVQLVDKQARYIGSDGVTYWEEDLDFGIEDKNNPDYWTRLEHQAAIAAMQSLIMTSTHNFGTSEQIAMWANEYATALVKELKDE